MAKSLREIMDNAYRAFEKADVNPLQLSLFPPRIVAWEDEEPEEKYTLDKKEIS